MHPMIQRGIEKIESEIQEELMEAYELFDTRNKGYIDGSGLSEAMKVLGYQAQIRQVQQMIDILDESGKGVIKKETFKKFMTARLDHRDEPQELKSAFEYYDSFKKGKITEKDLVKMAVQLGQDQAECPRMIYEADKDQDGGLNYEEFFRCIKKTSYY